jgi:Transcription factor WhiB
MTALYETATWAARYQPPPWQRFAACKDSDPSLFFPDGDTETTKTIGTAKAVCESCPVQAECLDLAMSFPLENLWGIWAGTTRAGRLRMRNEARRDAPPEPQSCEPDRQQKRRRETVCGTSSGYYRHNHNKEPVCDACRDARNTYRQARRRAGQSD